MILLQFVQLLIKLCTSPFGACGDWSLVLGPEVKRVMGVGPMEYYQGFVRQIPQERLL